MVMKSCKHCGSPFDAKGRALYCSPECKDVVLKEQRRRASKKFHHANPNYQHEYFNEWATVNADRVKELAAQRDLEAKAKQAREARASGLWNVSVRTGTEAGDVPKDEAKLMAFLRKERERLNL